jgi:tetratricopeptide (TPR) repeat protein
MAVMRELFWLSLAFALLATLSGCSASAPLPARAVALNRAGAEALERGDLDTAEARLSVALEYNPRFVEALTNLGIVETQRGNFGRARELLNRSCRINPDVAQPHHALGVLREREGRRDLASRHYRDALRVDPGFSPARANYARLLFEAGMLEHARIQFLRLTQVAPDIAAGYSGLAESLIRLGRADEAEAVIASGLERAPGDPSLVILDARSLIRHDQLAAAASRLQPLTRTRDDHAVAALSWLAVAELARGRPQAALRAAARARELNPTDPLVAYTLALTLRELNDPRAAAWLERAKQLVPGQQSLEHPRTPANSRATRELGAPPLISRQLPAK